MTHDLQNVAVASMETTRKLVELDGSQFSARGQRSPRDWYGTAGSWGRCCAICSRLRASEMAGDRETVDVARVVREAVARAQTTSRARGSRWRRRAPSRERRASEDRSRVRDLLSNACKYVGDKPAPRIEIGVRPRMRCRVHRPGQRRRHRFQPAEADLPAVPSGPRSDGRG